MENLLNLPGTRHVRPLHFFDAQAQPTRCDLLVHPAQGWAVATELPQNGRAGINQCPQSLAAKFCGEYGIALEALVLLARYAYPDEDSYFLVRFVHGSADLFDGFTFAGPSREPLDPNQVEELFTQLTAGQEPQPQLRAIHPTTSRPGSKK